MAAGPHFCCFCLTTLASAQYSLTYHPSPTAYGRGGVYATGATDDPLAPLSNPAFLGLMAERNAVMTAFFPQRTEWSPLPWSDDIKLGYFSRVLYVGFDRATLGRNFGGHSPISVGIGYQEVLLDMGKFSRTDEFGNSLGAARAFETQHGFALAVGLHHPHWQAGVGFSHGYVYNRMGFFAPKRMT